MVRNKILALGLSGGSLIACRESAPVSQLQIHNGIEARQDEFPAVVLLMTGQENARSYCTGVFVNEFQVLTTAHCLGEQSDVFLLQSKGNDQGGKALYEIRSRAHESHIHPSYTPSNNARNHAHDLAIVDFPPGVSDDFIEIASEPATPDSDVVLVGFGASEVKPGLHAAKTPDIKRTGRNVIETLENGVYSVVGMPQRNRSVVPGKFVSSGFGDSGSPWIVDNKVVSLTIGAELKPQTNGSWLPLSYAVDLTSPKNQEFLANWID